jgi:ubiquinone biosynthesis protein UbiJ
MLSVKPMAVIALLVEAIKELKGDKDSLEARLEKIEELLSR